jgi:predicted nucleotidyltransferase
MFAARTDVRAAWLYGSVARGEDDSQSDIDLAVLTERPLGVDASALRDAVVETCDALGMHASVIVLSPDELAAIEAGDPWFANVTKDALVLKGAAPAAERELSRRSSLPA